MKGTQIRLEDVNIARLVCGERDLNLKEVEQILEVEIFARGTDLKIRGKPDRCRLAARLLNELYALGKRGVSLTPPELAQAARVVRESPGQPLSSVFTDQVAANTKNKSITPKTVTQKRYVDAIRSHDIVFGWGPAGTGKTYLAMAMAVSALTNREVDRIILTRPAVEAGEKLGFLPGDLAEKVNPYLRPLYDALHDMMPFDRAEHLVSNGTIEVAPLAFMRGRTLNNSFVILDEAQNTTGEQMKMFLTRLGFDSKAVITGDITQIDLPEGKRSGLAAAMDLLKDIPGIAWIQFTDQDVVRHPLVVQIIRAYEEAEKKRPHR